MTRSRESQKNCTNGYYVYNPATKQSKKLLLAHNDSFIHVESLHLVFDPSRSPYYKIVCIRAEQEPIYNLKYQIEVFNSESGTWRVCVEPFTSREIMKFDACVHCKDWIYLIHNQHRCGHVYRFDIVKNASRLVVFPLTKFFGCHSHSLQESNGRLYYCILSTDDNVYMWELQVNEDDPRRLAKWLLKYKGRIHSPLNKIGLDMLTFIPETGTVLIHAFKKIMAYDLRDKSYKELLDLGNHPYPYSVHAHQFGETLALL